MLLVLARWVIASYYFIATLREVIVRETNRGKVVAGNRIRRIEINERYRRFKPLQRTNTLYLRSMVAKKKMYHS